MTKSPILPGVLVACTLLLPGCNDEANPDDSAAATVVTATTEGTIPPARVPETNAAGIPVAYHGIWDGEEGTCNPASDMRIEVKAEAVGFYESYGTVTGIRAAPDGGLTVDLAMEGEGEKWNTVVDLAIKNEGVDERLITRFAVEGEPAQQPLALKRCPA